MAKAKQLLMNPTDYTDSTRTALAQVMRSCLVIKQAERYLESREPGLLHYMVPVTLRYHLPRTMSCELDSGLSSVRGSATSARLSGANVRAWILCMRCCMMQQRCCVSGYTRLFSTCRMTASLRKNAKPAWQLFQRSNTQQTPRNKYSDYAQARLVRRSKSSWHPQQGSTFS